MEIVRDKCSYFEQFDSFPYKMHASCLDCVKVTNFNLMILATEILMILISIKASSTKLVDITYLATTNDQFKIKGITESSICSCEFRAGYVLTNHTDNSVTCKCGIDELFFGQNGQSVKCRPDIHGLLYGKYSFFIEMMFS